MAEQNEDPAADNDLFSWAMSLGVTVPTLRQAIAEVGSSAAAVRRRLPPTLSAARLKPRPRRPQKSTLPGDKMAIGSEPLPPV
jgi:hypothetical protein